MKLNEEDLRRAIEWGLPCYGIVHWTFSTDVPWQLMWPVFTSSKEALHHLRMRQDRMVLRHHAPSLAAGRILWEKPELGFVITHARIKLTYTGDSVRCRIPFDMQHIINKDRR